MEESKAPEQPKAESKKTGLGRFDYVAYDEQGMSQQTRMKDLVITVEKAINELGPSRPISLALTALEECYMWIGKAIRDQQIERNGSAPLQEGRTNS